MLKHRLQVRAPIGRVLGVLDQAEGISAVHDGRLNVVEFADGIGNAHEVDGHTQVDLFDEDDGVQVDRMVDALRGAGIDVQHLRDRPDD